MVAALLPVLLPLIFSAIVASVLLSRLAPTARAPQPRFTDVTSTANLRFFHQRGGDEAPTTLGGGVTVLDFNRDGQPDLYFSNGAPWPWEETLEKRPARSGALFRNDGDNRFTEVTAAAGLNTELQAMAAVAADYDNDGEIDLFVSCIGRNRLFRNLGGGRFEDVTEASGLGGEENVWSTGAAWLDIDHDGRLDLIVLHYARWPAEVPLGQAFAVAQAGRSYGSPVGFGSVFPSVFRNLGEGRFVPVAHSAGLREVDTNTRRAVAQPLAVVVVDADGDAWLDVCISYQDFPSSLFLGQPDGTFRKSVRGSETLRDGSGAGLAVPSLLSSSRHEGSDPRFRAWRTPLLSGAPAAHTALAEKFGVALLDLDLDGEIELFSAQGLAEPAINTFPEPRNFRAEPTVFWRPTPQHWEKVPSSAEQPFALPPLVARGIAAADFDGDGDPDVVIAQNNGAPLLLRNDQRLNLPWLRVRLRSAHGQHQAFGARVEVHTPRGVQVQALTPALGYLAQSEETLTFGLGDDARVRRVVVRWPSGQVQEFKPEGLNRTLLLEERPRSEP